MDSSEPERVRWTVTASRPNRPARTYAEAAILFALPRSSSEGREIACYGFVNRRSWGGSTAPLWACGRRPNRREGIDGMSFLQRFLKTNVRQGRGPSPTSSFRDLNDEALEAHLGIARYGRFVLTEAV